MTEAGSGLCGGKKKGQPRPGGRGGRFHLREDKEAFDAEMCAHH